MRLIDADALRVRWDERLDLAIVPDFYRDVQEAPTVRCGECALLPRNRGDIPCPIALDYGEVLCCDRFKRREP